jgi:predicted esterase
MALLVLGCGGPAQDDTPDADDAKEVKQDDGDAQLSEDIQDTQKPPKTCSFKDDDSCDEPANCPLGTDTNDCIKACEGEYGPELWGACNYLARGIPDHEAVSDDLSARGSNGSGGGYGYWQDTIWAASPNGNGEVRRHYLVYVPKSYTPKRPTPLVYYLAGFGVSMYGNNSYSALDQLAERHGFVVVYAQQHYRNMSWIGWIMGWHVYNQAFAGDWWDNPDLDFLERLTQHMESLYNIDRTRVYATGHSRGGGMSILAGFLAPKRFAGFCAQAGFVGVNNFIDVIKDYKGRKMPAVFVHGNWDDNVGIGESLLAKTALEKMGWGDMLRYYTVDKVGHRWQPQLNQDWWDLFYSNPLDLDEVAP